MIFNRQKYGEILQYYTRQFNILTEILESHLGGLIIFENYGKTIEGYNETNPNKINTMVKQISDSLFACIYLDNLNYDKYGSIIQSPNSRKLLGSDQYPRTFVETYNMWSNINSI